MRVRCDWCGKEFRTSSYQIRRNKHHFCSRNCIAKWRSENICGETHPNWKGGRHKFKCDWCGETFFSKHDPERSKHHFCSRKCKGKWWSKNIQGENHPNWRGVRVEVKCDGCGKLYRVKRKDLKGRKNHFCSYECYWEWVTGENSPFWKGGHEPYYGPNWFRQARITRERDYTCQICGREEDGRALDVHHIIPFREFGLERYKEANQLSNLITLCRPCHVKADSGKISIDVPKGMIA